MQRRCNDCPRKCNALRDEKTNVGGFCRMPDYPQIARADLHFWEEPCISGQNGSGTIFFSGCNLNCVYCQNYEISHKDKGRIITPDNLAQLFYELEQKGAHNINFVNPTHYFSAIKTALNIYKPQIPLVYNSGGYDLSENIQEDIFDIYLMDLKYISSDNSLKYSSARDYFDVASNAIKAAYTLKGKPIIKDGIMQSGLIVRHLCLPLATRQAMGVIDWFCQNTPNAYLSIMSQYTPIGQANKYPEINRRITKREYEKVLEHLYSENLDNVYVQDYDSSGAEYIPEFNF